MLQPFLRNPFYKTFCFCFIFLPFIIFSKEEGLIERLDHFVYDHRIKFQEYVQVIKSKSDQSQLSEIENIKIDAFFLRSLIFHSNFKYIKTSNTNICSFYLLLQEDLLKTTLGRIEAVVVRVKFKKEEDYQPYYMKKKDFINYIKKKKCFENNDIEKLFNLENLKETMKLISFKKPKDKKECSKILNDWKENKYIYSLCGLDHKIKKGDLAQRKNSLDKNLTFLERRNLQKDIFNRNALLNIISKFERSYISNLCEGINDEKKFCKKYLESNFWIRILNGELKEEKLSYLCSNFLKKKKVNRADLKKCVKSFNRNKKICINKVGGESSVNCEQLAEALEIGNLNTNYRDCPKEIGNGSILNIYRIINHFKGQNKSFFKERCSFQTYFEYKNLFNRDNYEDVWGLKICFPERYRKKEVCKSYLPGFNLKDERAENRVMEKVIRDSVDRGFSGKCLFLKKKEALKGFGCFISIDKSSCEGDICKRKVYYNKKEVKEIKYKGKTVSHYFQNNKKHSYFTLNNMIKEKLKKKLKKIKSFSELKIFLNDPKSIIHGIGCVENLTPSFLKSRSFNQCHPMPFIIDGFKEKKDGLYVSFRSSSDNLHIPRLINWRNIYNSVEIYSKLNPQRIWTLNGIK